MTKIEEKKPRKQFVCRWEVRWKDSRFGDELQVERYPREDENPDEVDSCLDALERSSRARHPGSELEGALPSGDQDASPAGAKGVRRAA